MKKDKEVTNFMMDITTGEMSIDLGGQRIFPNWKFKKVKKC